MSTPRATEARFPRRHTPVQKARLVSEVLFTYLRTQRLLRRQGLPAAIERARSVESVPAPGRAEIGAHAYGVGLGKLVVRVLSPLPADTRCLARSLVLTGILARRGVVTSLVIGVSPAPKFEAHAWVEHDHRPLLPTGKGAFERLLEL